MREPGGGPLAERLEREIRAAGPIPLAHYMAVANAHYYATRDPFGAAGDFVTAPEISQMFGELIGAWLADLWQRAGSPPDCHYVELGPGRGTLAADALRAARSGGLAPRIALVETSPVLRGYQAERLPDAAWHEHVDSLPETGPLLIVANEFFDALPIRQLVKTAWGWSERLVAHADDRFVPVAGPAIGTGAIPKTFRDAPEGTILEASPASVAIVDALAGRLERQGGVLLAIDYGHAESGAGDTLQAVRGHAFADPWSAPGERDLTAHVDFEALAAAALRNHVQCHGPVEQGTWLRAIGIDLRTDALSARFPDRADDIASARSRLVSPDQMGSLFKVMAVTAQGWEVPAGFGESE